MTSPSQKASVLLRGGTVLTHDNNDHVVPLYDTDVLIRGNIIADVGKNLSSPTGEESEMEVIDCHGKIVSPGFVDTHHHLWQTQLKGRHAEEGLVSYMVTGKLLPHHVFPYLNTSSISGALLVANNIGQAI